VIDEYQAFFHGNAGSDGAYLLSNDFILIEPRDNASLRLIAAASRWKQLYRDGTCVLFAAQDSAAAQLRPVIVPAQDTPKNSFP